MYVAPVAKLFDGVLMVPTFGAAPVTIIPSLSILPTEYHFWLVIKPPLPGFGRVELQHVFVTRGNHQELEFRQVEVVALVPIWAAANSVAPFIGTVFDPQPAIEEAMPGLTIPSVSAVSFGVVVAYWCGDVLGIIGIGALKQLTFNKNATHALFAMCAHARIYWIELAALSAYPVPGASNECFVTLPEMLTLGTSAPLPGATPGQAFTALPVSPPLISNVVSQGIGDGECPVPCFGAAVAPPILGCVAL